MRYALCAMRFSDGKLPKKKIRERMDYFKEQAQQLMKIRKSGHRPAW
jgi:hypothetical protein